MVLRLIPLAAVSAAIAVAAGAFGSHGASGRAAELLSIGGMYQLTHAIAAIALSGRYRGPAKILLGGSALFAISLYVLALGGARWMGMVAPIGGSAMILGWLWLAYLASASRNDSTSDSETDLST